MFQENSSPRFSLRNMVMSIITVLLLFPYFSLIQVALAEDTGQENVDLTPISELESRQMSRRAEQRMFLDVLSGKAVGPSADNTVPAQYELDAAVVASINAAVPKQVDFQVGLPGFGEAAFGALNLLINNTYSTYVVLVRAARLRRLVNLDLWTRAVMEGTLYSPAMEHLSKPTLLELLPYKALPRPVIDSAIAQAPESGRKCPVVDQRYGVANGINNKLWYFRDDFELNIEHWYWHLTYPLRMDPNGRPDRRGELFYYLHQSLLARHNAKRLANGLPLTISLQVSTRSVVQEAYYPFLSNMYTGKYWPARPPNQPIDYNGKEGENIPGFVQAVYAAIDAKALTSADGEIISLTNIKGIDYLVDVVESNAYSVNLQKYGGIHNDGHLLIARLGNTTDSFWGAMAELSTSIRDPSFFRWHTFIQEIFLRHKLLLPPYSLKGGVFPLIWNGVEVKLLEVDEGLGKPLNNLHTFWAFKKFDISRYINSFKSDSEKKKDQMPVCLKHLQHQRFEYRITIASLLLFSKATVRIFIAPRYDVDGKKRFSFEQQRQLFFVLDAFTINLKPGINFITRKSNDTTFTRPFSKSFAQLEREVETGFIKKPQCGCGLPHHLLLPKGTEAGMDFDLFVMVTNGAEDSKGNLGDQSTNVCTAPYHWCGRPGQKYPDNRPMGYPFDRLPPTTPGQRINTLEDYVGLIPNSKSIPVVIVHKN